MGGSYATAPDQTCVRIASSATLRRRFAQKTMDTGFCYPCPPTLLLPISPAAHIPAPSPQKEAYDNADDNNKGRNPGDSNIKWTSLTRDGWTNMRIKQLGQVCDEEKCSHR